jgi:hypothetical protein
MVRSALKDFLTVALKDFLTVADRRTVGAKLTMSAVVTVCLSGYPTIRLSAQTPPEALPRIDAATDSAHHVGPVGALWRSLLIPGWGQAVTGRHVTGALFAVWEGTTMYMTLKARQEADYFRASGAPNLDAKRQEVQDWLVLWGFNHLFSGAEAFVAAHLRDFPKDLKVRAVPGGIGIRLPFPRR